MTKAQDRLYWRAWAAARRADETVDRHDLHRHALGYDKSHKDLTNSELDRVLAEFQAVSDPDNLDAQLRFAEQPRRRLLWVIGRLAPAPYRDAVMRVRWGHCDCDRLNERELAQLRFTLTRAAHRHHWPGVTVPHAGDPF
jgi:hypothetical protein